MPIYKKLNLKSNYSHNRNMVELLTFTRNQQYVITQSLRGRSIWIAITAGRNYDERININKFKGCQKLVSIGKTK